jgi:hypothetical protein
MSDRIVCRGDSMGLLRATVLVAQKLQQDFEELADDCENANSHGGCLINTIDGCLLLGCPLGKG